MIGSRHAPASPASPIDQVALDRPAQRARRLVRVQIGTIAMISTAGALLGMLAVGLPNDDRAPVLAALAAVVVLGSIFVGLTDLLHGRSVAALVGTASELRQSAAERAADLARVNGALRRQEERRSALLATMSHELRTPLNAMIGCSRMLLDGLDGELNSEQRGDVRRIHDGGRTLLSIVDGTLDLARLDAGALRLECKPVAVRPVFDDVVAMLRPLADERGLNLEATVAEIPPAAADEERLRQVLVNLVGNAIKFTDLGGIRLSAELADGRVVIAVADTGIGIPADSRALIFEPFRQADQSRTRRRGGTGLGLAISRRLVDLMHGHIRVESDPGAGSTFFVTLPTATERSNAAPVTPGDDRYAVLVVGEEGRTRSLLDTLARRGVRARGVGTTEWLHRADSAHPQILLADTGEAGAGAWRALASPRPSNGRGAQAVGLVHLDGDAGHLVLHPRLDVRSIADLERNVWALVRDLAPSEPFGRDPLDARMIVIGANLIERRRLSLLFEGVGLRACEAASFAEAKMIARRQPALGLAVDLTIPDGGIVPILAEIGADSRWRDLPVMVVTPNALTAGQQHDLVRSVDAWRCEPSKTVEQLADDIESALVRRSSELALAGRRLWPVH
jgi:signal transduction histidine kinase/CheY-like chemotaxis protein